MPNHFLVTKFHLPAWRSGNVARPRLIERLQAGLAAGRKLTLIAAPAGYGKTTLAAEWLHVLAGQSPVAWLALEPGDAEPVRFFAYCLAALQRVRPSLGQDARTLLNLLQAPPLTTLLDDLINDLASLDAPLILALDDYHVINQPACTEALNYLVEHQPPQLHLLLLSRTDPSLPLPRLRARGQMTEIRGGDLRFTTSEARQFFSLLPDFSLAEGTVRSLDERTEGWVAGLQLAALALQNQPDMAAFVESFRGSHRYVLDYLAEEVIRQQSEATRSFLVQTGVLDRFDADLCNILTGRSDSQAVIVQLEQANLFLIPLDDERRWYRYHHLFADYLRTLLTKFEKARLYKAAAEWYLSNNLVTEAVRYAFACEDWDFTACVLEQALKDDATWSSFDLGLFTSWLEALPMQALQKRPRLCLETAHIFYAAGRLEASEALIEQAQQIIQAEPEMFESGQLRALASLYQGLIASVRGEFQHAVDQITTARSQIQWENRMAHISALFSLGQAYRGLDEIGQAITCYLRSSDEAKSAGMLFPMVNSRCAAAHLQIVQGRLRLAEQTCRQAIAYAHGARIPQLGLAWTILGGIALERNNLAAAESLLLEGLGLSRQAHLNDDVTWGLIFLARLRAAQEDFASALAAMQEAHDIITGYGVQRLSLLASSYLARTQQQAQQQQLAAQWAESYRAVRNESSNEHADLTLARILISTGELVGVADILRSLLVKAEAAERRQTTLETVILLSLYHRAQGKTAAALEWLEKSLALAAPEGYLRIFLDEGTPLLELLPKVRRAAPDLVDAILDANQPLVPSRATLLEKLPEPLSEQEFRVLKLIVQGKTNAEIAGELVISVGTAKWHVHNILQKLGVSNRPQAIARARELGV